MLFLKLLRDIRKNLFSAITIVIITAMGIMFWTGFEGIAANGLRITDQFYAENALPDLFVTGNRLTDADLRDMERNGALSIMGRNTANMTVPDLDDAVLRVYAQDMPAALNKPVVVRGSAEAMGSPRSIMVDEDFLVANGLDIGDQLRLLYEGHFYTFHIIAGIKTPENIYVLKDVSAMMPDRKMFSYALVNDGALRGPLYGGEEHVYNQAVMTTADPESLRTYLSDRFAGKVTSVIGRSEHLSYSMVDLEFSTMDAIVGVFPTIFFIIAALISFTSLKRMVDKERTTIGTMKALGVRDAVVLVHYTSYGLLYGVLAAAVGVPLGILIPRAMFSVMDIFFSLPPYTLALDVSNSALAAVVAVAVSVLSSFWACKSVLALSPSVCMRPKTVKSGKKVLLERVGFLWSRLGDIRRIILRNLFRNKDRLVMSVFGVSCSCALVFMAFGMQSSIDNLTSTAYETVNRYEMKVFLAHGATRAQAKRIAALPGAALGELVMETGGKLEGNTAVQKTAAITVLPDRAQLLGLYEGRDLSAPLPDSGCILSDVLAGELGVQEGDPLRISFTGRSTVLTLPVEQVIVQNFGQGVFVSESAWRQMGEGFYPNAVLLDLSPGTAQQPFQKRVEDYDFVLSAQYQSQLKDNLETDLQMADVSISIMLTFAGMMAFIVLFNLGILNFYEREREIATLKVVGFYDREVRKMAFGENYVFTCIGCVLGLIMGNAALGYMLDMVETEHYTFTKYVTPATFGYTILTLFLFALMTNLFLGRYVKRLDMISSLKGVE